MAKKPEGMSVEEWRAQRAEHFRRINRVLNVLMVVAAALVLWRYLSD